MIRRRLVLGLFLLVSIAVFGVPGVIDGTFSAMTDKENINGSAQAGYWNGNIRIIKDTLPTTDSQLFTFTPAGDGLPDALDDPFDLKDDGTPNADRKLFAGLQPGIFTFTEGALDPVTFDITDISCTVNDGGGTDTPVLSTVLYKGGANDAIYEDGDNQVEITLQGGDLVECTFENTKRAEIIVDKVTNPSTDTTQFDFTVKDGTAATIDTFQLAHATAPHSTFVKPGNNNTVSETVVTGWSTASSCTSGTAADLDLVAGQVVTCTFTNTKLGSITIVKDDTENSDTIFDFTAAATAPATISPNDFDLQDDGTPGPTLYPTTQFADLMPGTYTFTELAEDDYEVIGIACTVNSGGTSTFKYLGDSQAPIADTFGEGDNQAQVTLVAGSNVTCTFSNEPTTGTIVIKKVTVPSTDNEEFDFDSNVPGHTDFDLSHDETETMPDLDEPVTPYTVSETAETGYVITGISCTGQDESVVKYLGGTDDDIYDQGDDEVSIDLAPSETVECTFTNSRLPTLEVIKQLNPTNDTGKFDLVIDSTTYDNDPGSLGYGHNGTTGAVILQPGSHTVTEAGHGSTVLTDYEGRIVCDSSKGSTTLGDITHTFSLAYGDVVTCTITNNRLPQVMLRKMLAPTTEDDVFAFVIEGNTDNNGGNGYGHNETTEWTTVQDGQDVTISELGFLGSSLTDYSTQISCDSGEGNAPAGATSYNLGHLDYGDKVLCTFTNTKKASLTVKKVVTNDDLGGSDPDDFSIHVKLGASEVSGSPQPGNSTTGTTYLLAPGTYVVSETGPGGYDLTFSAPCPGGSITLSAGEVATCTLTNNDQEPGTLIINKTCAYPSPLTTPTSANTAGGTLGYFNFAVTGVDPADIPDDIRCGAGTGSIEVSPGVALTITETAGIQTDTNDFTTTFSASCAGGSVTVASGASVTCTVTNTVKATVPARCSEDGFSSAGAIIIGTAGDDVLDGGNVQDLIIGLGGNDTIDGKQQADCLIGGPGNDTIYGGNGGASDTDVLIGGPGDDTLNGENGPDTLYGDEGNDNLDAGNGGGECHGGAGTDVDVDDNCTTTTGIP